MTIQRTWNFGFKAGLLTGLGSSVADCLYAASGAFGLTLISNFLLQYQTVISILGGGLILFIGIRLMLKKKEVAVTQVTAMGSMRSFLSSFVIGITNPTAILTFLFAFSYFGISDINEPLDGIQLVCGVFIGTYIWWGTLSAITHVIKKKMKRDSLPYINRLFGVILTLIGAGLFIRIVI